MLRATQCWSVYFKLAKEGGVVWIVTRSLCTHNPMHFMHLAVYVYATDA